MCECTCPKRSPKLRRRTLSLSERILARLRRVRWLNYKYVEVYHQDSPGVRLMVLRNWISRLLLNPHFNSVGERHYPRWAMDASLPVAYMEKSND